MKRTHAFVTAAATLGAVAVLYACSGDDTSGTTPITQHDSGGIITPNDSAPSTPTNDANPPPTGDAQPPDCFTGTPTTYDEIINACTDAQAIDKTVDLTPMNLADGGLQLVP
jgi:hypothetical protein